MASELDNALKELILLLGEIPGLRTVTDRSPENVSAFPLLMAMPQAGTWEAQSAAMVRGLHTLQLGCYVARKGDTAREIEAVLPFGELIKDKLYAAGNTTWNSTIDTIVGQIAYTFGPVDYAEMQLLGWTITIPIKINSTETSGVFSK